jgi:uncharacterized protein involved in outer membrane biogenesis
MPKSSDDTSESAPSLLRRVLVWGGSVLGGLAVLVLVVALVLPRLFTSEQLKGYVVPPLEEATGRQVEIDDIGLRVLLTPAIRVSGFRLANAEGYGPAPAVEARALNVDVALWPLFVGSIRPTSVALVEPVVRYEVSEDGATNFDDLGGAADTTEAAGDPLGGIPVSNLRVSGAKLHYADQSTGQALRLGFDAQLGAFPDGSAFTSEGTVDFGTVQALLPSVGPDTLTVQDAQADYDVRVAPSAGRVDLRSLRLDTAPFTLTVEGGLSGLNERPTVDLTFETGSTDLAEVAAFVPAAAVEGLNPRGTVRLEGTLSGALSGDADGETPLSVTATGQLAGIGVDYEGASLLRDLNADLSGSLNSVALRSVQGQLLGTSLAGEVAVRDLGTEPQVDLDLETGPMDLATLAAFAPSEQVDAYNPQGTFRLDVAAEGPMPEDAETLTEMTVDGNGQLAEFGVDYEGNALLRSLRADLQFSGTAASVREIDGQLLGEPLTGAVTVEDPLGAPQVNGQLAGTADLAQLAALAGDASMAESVRGTADYDVSFAGPLDTPDAIRPEGRVRMADVQVPYESFRHPVEIPDATVQLTGTGLSMDRFTIRSGEQTAALQATVRNLFPLSKGLAETDPALAADVTLTSDRLNLVDLYPEADTGDVSYSQLFAAHLSGSEMGGQSPAAVAKEVYGDVELPAYAVDGRVEIATLLNDPQRFDDLTMDVQMDDRRLELRNLSASTYGGDLAGTLTLDQSGSSTSAVAPEDGSVLLASVGNGRAPARLAAAPSDLTYDFELQDVEAGAVLEDWTSLGRLVTGSLTFDADGNTALTEGLLPETTAFTAVGQSLVANGGLSLDLGPASALVDALGLPGTRLKQFERLGGPFAIEEGQFQLNAWTFGGDRFDGTVEGALGLGGSVDLEMTMDLPLSMLQNSTVASRVGGDDGGLGDVLTKLVGGDAADDTVPVTVRFGGTMGDPSVQVLNQDAIGKKIRSIAKEQGLNRLRDLFGGGGE